MKRLFSLAAILLIASFSFAQNDTKIINDSNARPRKVEGFHGVSTADGIDLYLTQGNEEAVAVSANKEEYRDNIITKVENGILKIYYKREGGLIINWRDRRLRAYVSVKSIDLLHASGGADVIVNGVLATGKLEMEFSGGSDFVGEVNVNDQLKIGASGGSDIKIKGKAVNVKVDASGGSDFLGYGLVADYMIVDVSGGSDAQLNVQKELYAEASGGSDINYKGNPVIRKSSASGGGSVTKNN